MRNNEFFKYSGLGLEFGITVLMFVFLGLYLDKKFNTMPLFILVMSLVGFSSAVYLMYKTFERMKRDDKETLLPDLKKNDKTDDEKK